MVTSLNATVPVRDNGPNYNASRITLTATTTLTAGAYSGSTIILDNATGFTVTLPASTGAGGRYRFIIKTTVTSGNMVIKVANTADSFVGNILVNQDGGATVTGFEVVANDDTLTLNGTTTGGIAGDEILIEDIALNIFLVRMIASGTGTEATPSSATV